MKKEYEQRIQELEAKIEQLKKNKYLYKSIAILDAEMKALIAEIKEDETEKEWPQEGDKIYFKGGCNVDNSFIFDPDLPIKSDWLRIDLIAKTDNEAVHWQKDRAKRKEILDRIKELNEGWLPTWVNNSEDKFCPYLKHRTLNDHFSVKDSEIGVFNNTFTQHCPDEYYLKDIGSYNKLDNEFGDDLEVLFKVL